MAAPEMMLRVSRVVASYSPEGERWRARLLEGLEERAESREAGWSFLAWLASDPVINPGARQRHFQVITAEIIDAIQIGADTDANVGHPGGWPTSAEVNRQGERRSLIWTRTLPLIRAAPACVERAIAENIAMAAAWAGARPWAADCAATAVSCLLQAHKHPEREQVAHAMATKLAALVEHT